MHRNFRLFWIGQTISLIGTWMQSMAQGWLALELSDSAFMVGMVSVAAALPVVLLSMHAGVLVDRYERLRIVRIAQMLMMGDALLLWAFTLSGHITIGLLLALATLHGTFTAIEIPARQALVIQLVGREDMREAIALNSSGFNLARIVGPWLGAFVVARFGIAWAFGINALSYMVVIAGLMLMRLPPWQPHEARASALAGIVELANYMKRTPVISSLMRLVLVFSVFGVPYIALMPVVARDLLGLSARGYGLLLGSVGLGGLFGALALAAAGHRFRRGQLLGGSALAYAILLVGFAFVRSPVIAYPVLFSVGFAMIVTNAMANTLLQSVVPDYLRGRLMAAYSFVVVGLSQVLGAFVAGSVAEAVGVEWAVGGGGGIMLLYALWAFRSRWAVRPSDAVDPKRS